MTISGDIIIRAQLFIIHLHSIAFPIILPTCVIQWRILVLMYTSNPSVVKGCATRKGAVEPEIWGIPNTYQELASTILTFFVCSYLSSVRLTLYLYVN
jgi:hypothetical protein